MNELIKLIDSVGENDLEIEFLDGTRFKYRGLTAVDESIYFRNGRNFR